MTRQNSEWRLFPRYALSFILVCIAALVVQTAMVRAADVNTGYFGKVAIMGYDPVAYFTMKDAVKGSEEYSFEWLGATWLFLNEAHREAFSASPTKYAPQYGGLCALGVAYGEVTREINPEAWSIIKGKLYLNYSKGATAEFSKDSGKYIAKADNNWPDVKVRLSR